MDKIGKIRRPEEAAADGPISVVIDASPRLLRSAGVNTYVFHGACSLAEAAGTNRLSRFLFLDGRGTFTHQGTVLGSAETWIRLGLLHSAHICPYPILVWFTPAADVF